MPGLNAPTVMPAGAIDRFRRVHITNPLQWANAVGTDFWLYANANGSLTASTQYLITDGGWTATSLSTLDGTLADLMTKSDVGTPGSYVTNAGADLLSSPAIFGDYAHAHAAAVIMGQKSLPRYLIMDAYAAFDTNSADEQTTNIGFIVNGGSPVTSANVVAAFNSDATNFRFQSGATRATNTVNVAVNTVYNWYRLVLDRGDTTNAAGLIRASINGAVIGTQALVDDRAPYKFGFGDGTTNRIQLNQVHIFYAYRLGFDPALF